MQWSSSALDLEGSFGCGISEIFSGLSLPKNRSKNHVSKFQILLKVLSRTGIKLHEHGMFSYASSGDYLQETQEELVSYGKLVACILRMNLWILISSSQLKSSMKRSLNLILIKSFV